MTWELRKVLPLSFLTSFADADPVMNRNLNDYEESAFSGATNSELVPLGNLIRKTEEQGDLYDAVSFGNQITIPLVRELEHCGQSFAVSPFAIYATCPHCGTQWKVRGFSSHAEVEDVFDAVFEWLTQPQATKLLRQRQREIEADRD